MNISELNNIYCYINLKEGEHANFIMKSIEEEEMTKLNINNFNNNDGNNKINKEIKF